DALADTDDAILIDALIRHFLDGDDIGSRREAARRIHHLRQAATLVLHQNVRQQQREGLATDQLARAPHRVAEAERLLLAGKTRRARDRQLLGEEFQRVVLLALE